MKCRQWLTSRVAAILLVASAFVGCSQEKAPEARRVVLITVDTLRADHLGAYGSQTTQTPNMDRLAKEGVLFETAISPLPETRPAHFTIFTSRYPRDHGVMNNAGVLSDSAITLPATFAAAGFRTAGFAGCALFDEEMGNQLGFEHFDAPETPQRAAHEVVPKAIEWMRSLEPNEPFFLWLHLFDPHMPYSPPPPFNRAAEKGERWPQLSWTDLLATADRNNGDLPAAVLARGKELYSGEVDYVDHWLGRFFEAQESTLSTGGDPLVLLTADHGECFSKGVFFDHSQCLNEGAIAVPLMLRFPPSVPAGKRRRAPVEHLDIGPTLLRLAGVSVPKAFQGRGLLERTSSQTEVRGPGFFQHPFYRPIDISNRSEVLQRLRSVAGEPTLEIVGHRLQIGARTQNWKYIRRGEEENLFELSKDPQEGNDLAATDENRLRGMRSATRSWLRNHPVNFDEIPEISPDMVDKLRALGYL